MFTEQEINDFHKRGLTPEVVEHQIGHFVKGFPFIQLEAAATPGNGVVSIDDNTSEKLIQHYEQEASDLKILKFVPASGAASRMFSHLFSLQEALSAPGADPEKILGAEQHKMAKDFFDHLSDFAFYEELSEILVKRNLNLERLRETKEYLPVLETLLSTEGLSYAALPKGLLSFHKYGRLVRKAVEEHLVEGALYGCDGQKQVYIHFTLSPEHIGPFETLMQKVLPEYEKEYGVKYHITHSIQDSATDIIAVDMDNKPFHDKDNRLVFRPGGHGALINNLDGLDADIIFIKNIDNIVPDRLKEPTVRYKKVLAGLLLEIRDQVFEYLEALDEANMSQSELNRIRDFCVHKLMLRFPDEYGQFDMMEQVDYLYSRLNRPIRVCGMVRNEGEPGGGPFWVMNSEGETDLQIVESSQVDMKDPSQVSIFKASTHFNPVDLVCSTRNYKGKKFDLHEFVDPETGFISIKTKDGRQLKAQELPGLWNGAMAYWLTIFVEVPGITFNPVKTVNDLLRKNHREQE